MKQTSCFDSGDPKPVLPGWVSVCGAGVEDAVCRLQALPYGSCPRGVPLSRPSALAAPFPNRHPGVGWGRFDGITEEVARAWAKLGLPAPARGLLFLLFCPLPPPRQRSLYGSWRGLSGPSLHLSSSLLLAPGDVSAAAHHLDLALPALFLYPLCSGFQPPRCSPFQAGLSQLKLLLACPPFSGLVGRPRGLREAQVSPPPRDTVTKQNPTP